MIKESLKNKKLLSSVASIFFVNVLFSYYSNTDKVSFTSLTPSVLSSGMFDNATWRFSRVITMENFAFMLGSSKQGKAFLASVGSNWVVARYLEQERKHQRQYINKSMFLATCDPSICECIWSLTMADLTNDKFAEKMSPVSYMIDDNQITDSFSTFILINVWLKRQS